MFCVLVYVCVCVWVLGTGNGKMKILNILGFISSRMIDDKIVILL